MEVVAVLILGLIAAWWWKSSGERGESKPARSKQAPRSSGTGEAPASGQKYVIRQGKSVQADEVFDAWTSDDFERMKKALRLKTNPVDRHFLLMGVVEKGYKNRSNPAMAELCRETAEQHIAEFPDIAPALREDMDGIMPRVTTFQTYAKLLQERGEYDKAIEICEKALEYGLHDGTKSGFEGRIARIKKARDKARGA